MCGCYCSSRSPLPGIHGIALALLRGRATMRDDESDASLWLQATSGTERAFAILFDRHRTRVFRAAYVRTGNVADSEDIVAIVFLEAWRLRKKVRFVDGSLSPWLLAIASNVRRNFARSQRRYRRALSALPPPADEPDHAPSTDVHLEFRRHSRVLAEALKKLSSSDRAVVDLCLVDQLSLSAAASALHIPVGTVKSRLHRARALLQKELKGSGLSPEIWSTNLPPGERVSDGDT